MNAYQKTAISILKQNGLRPSRPRVAIYSFLLENRIHPTAKKMYHALLPDCRTLSLTTVYNTLRLLILHHLINPLTIEDGEIRYDVNTAIHAHFKCRCCGVVMDVSVPEDVLASIELTDLNVESVQIGYYGLCSKCSSK